MLRSFEVKKLGRDLPGYTFVHSYEAALPFYECILEIRILAKHELSALEQVVLSCVTRGLNSIEGIDLILGAGRELIGDALAGLLSADLIVPDISDSGRERFLLTDRGAEAFEQVGYLQPEPTSFKMVYDGLLGECSASNRLMYVGHTEALKKGLHLVPARCAAPSVSEIDRGELGRLIRKLRRVDPRRAPNGELHDIIGVSRVFYQYLPCDVVVFDAPDQSHLAFRVLDRGHRLAVYEPILQGMFARQPEVLPFVRPSRAPVESEPSLSLFRHDLLAKADAVEEEAVEIQNALAAARDVESGGAERSSTQPEDRGPTTREQLEAARAELEQEKKARLAELEREKGLVRRIETAEHRDLLLKAFRHARQRIIIVSPWLAPAAMNRELLDEMNKALRRGVEIVIGWGYPPDEENEKQKSKEDASSRMLYVLKQMARELEEERKGQERVVFGERSAPKAEKRFGHLRVVRLGDTHEKVLIVDLKHAVVTSFNWLSFRGDPRRPLRRESGYVVTMPDVVKEHADAVLARIEQAEAEARAGELGERVEQRATETMRS